MKKSSICLFLAGAVAFSLTACGGNPTASAPTPTPAPVAVATAAPAPTATPEPTPQPEQTVSFDPGFSVPIPQEYQELLLVTTQEPKQEDGGIFYNVYEKESVEAGQKQHPGEDWGDGWLFGLGILDQDRVNQMACYDMSGVNVFARREDGSYLLFYHPTDVRLMREEGKYEEGFQQWSILNEWAWKVPDAIVADNGFTPVKMTNTLLDMSLHRLAYQNAPYSLASLEFGGELKANDKVDRMVYLNKLMDGLTVEMVDLKEAPDGEYVVLNDPEFGERFDFFAADGNLVRETYGDGNVLFYRAVYADGTTVARDVISQWCAALAAANQA